MSYGSACAHLRVLYDESGTWACEDCNHRFVPISYRQGLPIPAVCQMPTSRIIEAAKRIGVAEWLIEQAQGLEAIYHLKSRESPEKAHATKLAKCYRESAPIIRAQADHLLNTEVPTALKRIRLFSFNGWEYKWIFEIERGAFRSGFFAIRRELRRWL